MTRPARNVVALVAINIEGLVPGPDETINDAVTRFAQERIETSRVPSAAVEAVYTDGEGFLDDFNNGDVPHPGVYESDRFDLGPLLPDTHSPAEIAAKQAEDAEDTYPAGTPIETYLRDEGTTIEAYTNDAEELYSRGVADGRKGLAKRHDSAQYDLGYAEGKALTTG